MSKRVLISIVVLVVAACVVLSVLALVGVFTLLPVRSATTVVESTVTPTQGEAVSPTQAEQTPQATAAGGAEIAPEELAAMKKIEQQTEKNRGLTLSGEIQRTLMTPEQLRQRVMDDFLKDYTPEDMAADQKVLSIFGLLPRGFDLKTLYTDLYSEQIAGFYDDKTNEMVVVQGEGFDGPERMTYAHEFTHALQDEAYDLTNGLKTDEATCRKDSEYCAAVQALIEGDATISEQLWLYNSASQQDRDQVDAFYSTYKSPVYDSAPLFMQQDFLFAYDQGANFVLKFYQDGGYAEVDKLYQNPPVSTEQILHPERYPNDKPQAVELPDFSASLGSGWEEIDNNTVGEWYTYLILAYGDQADARLDETTASQAAEGWGGDKYVVYAGPGGNDAALVYQSQWDTGTDSDEFWQAFQTYANDRWGKADQSGTDRLEWTATTDGAVLLQRNASGQVLWVVAPDAATVATLAGQVAGFGQ
ncbi:hypothetical protein FDZ74_02330 [bacterium]|nr:MAG: hypothetical protein FDZ74_02330 [bacterium]